MDRVPIVIAFTENYFVAASTFLISLLKNSSSVNRFHVICLLTDRLPDRMISALVALDSRISFEFLVLKDSLSDIYVDPRYTVAASYRLLIADLLPQYKKVLYMDCDIIVRNDMAELYNSTIVDDYYMAVIYEAVLPHQMDYIKSISCDPMYYFNSGVIVFNLEKLREDNMTDKFLEASKVVGLQFPDQDVLNKLCQGKVLGLSPIFNSIRTFFIPSYQSFFLKKYDKKLWNEVQHRGNVHYTGNKPWNSFTVNFGIWWRYYDMLPTTIKNEGQVSPLFKTLAIFYNKLGGKYLIDLAQSVYRGLRS